jgi:hypothetical protein
MRDDFLGMAVLGLILFLVVTQLGFFKVPNQNLEITVVDKETMNYNVLNKSFTELQYKYDTVEKQKMDLEKQVVQLKNDYYWSNGIYSSILGCMVGVSVSSIFSWYDKRKRDEALIKKIDEESRIKEEAMRMLEQEKQKLKRKR